MDEARLAALRAKYGDARGGDVFDPHFKSVADTVFQGERRAFPWGSPTTLLGASFRPEAGADPEAHPLDIALIGVPMDLGVTHRSGARFGPRAVRGAERIGPYEHVLKLAPLQGCRAADVGDVPLPSRYDLEACHEDIEAFFARVHASGAVPLAVGGDHSITRPILRALGRDRPVGMVHIDAHCDTSGPFEGSKFHHGGPFRQAVLDGVLDPARTVQIGIRGAAEYLWEFSYESGMTVIHAEELAERGVADVLRQALDVVGTGPTYVSFDIDALDPGFAPGTGTPEVGGLTPREALALLRGLREVNVIGADVVEVAPQYDATTNTVQAAGQVLFELACLARLALGRRS